MEDWVCLISYLVKHRQNTKQNKQTSKTGDTKVMDTYVNNNVRVRQTVLLHVL